MVHRGLRFQDDAFVVADVVGLSIEELWGASERPETAEVVFLKVSGLPWQRFFLDAGLGFWGEYPDDETFDAHQDIPRIDYGRLFGIVGRRLLRAECVAVGPARLARIVLVVESDGRVELRLIEPASIDSNAELVHVGAPSPGAG